MIIKPVNTNVITGFLGVGKTSLIKQLLKHKPANEVWAVLVNEFGEIGIDAGLINRSPTDGVVIKEVAGGCLCCAAGIPIQVAINQIIQRAKPDRLLIEPTGIGHPQQIINTLSEPHYQQVIHLQACLCLVDARKIVDNRYRQHEIYIQQLLIADVIVASKSELYQSSDIKALTAYFDELRINPNVVTAADHFSSPQLIDTLLKSLHKPHKKTIKPIKQIKPQHALLNSGLSAKSTLWFNQVEEIALPALNEGEVVCKINQGEGCFSVGWLISPSVIFDFDLLMAWIDTFKRPEILRLKAVMITGEGILGVNMVDAQLNLSELDDANDSRLEIIATTSLDAQALQLGLLACCG
ncbi:CobW family GTP-binding protein [Shewanella sp. HL-SH2]|uniref:CobW family GTP-binding protein n=1 Tax=Shewanella sp. HL-SH2 TaxID=3436238 RepID=UPI003EBE05D3